ncbi:hypothetical protein [Actinokineospora bangkokensis]|uniref:Small secreted protein n=1 Tax=Actinokineospora bangkokensis TaxID=1193682 RepID=A0A1Q9LJ67_9PSEU|nr:hypothetical protein [Actinokineospora bangkokensis]OLR92091.1 hypothetical protein BJP25_22330 [Actinokineospora bangkokensis]
MIRRRVVPALASVAIAIGSLSACGSDSGSGSGGSAGPASDPAVAWMDKVCGSLAAGGKQLSEIPSVDPTDPSKAKAGLVTFLTNLSTALGSVSTSIKDAGVPPVADGQATVDKAQATIDGARTSLDSAKTRLEAVSATDPVAFTNALQEISPSLSAFSNTEGPLKDLKANPELNEAFGKTPACKQVDSGTGSDSSAPTS